MFYGMYEFHLAKAELLAMTFGEMVDLINCLAVYKGVAREKKKLTYDQIMALR